MAVDPENVSKILAVLSHRIRREILLILKEKEETSFTDLLNALKIDTGKLSFHMRSLAPFVEQTESGKYKLSQAGEDAVRVIRDVESWSEVSGLRRKASQLALASFKKRTYAFLIDFGMMLILTVLVLLQVVIFASRESAIVLAFNLLFVNLGFLWGYSTILEGFKGQTIGKRVLGLSAVRIDGKKLGYEHAAVRNFGKILLPLDLVFGYMLKDPRFIRYFDKFAGTTVIDLRQKDKPPAENKKDESKAPP